jgi:hypothetical protein
VISTGIADRDGAPFGCFVLLFCIFNAQCDSLFPQ